jgi:beta-lactamase regulating signal transducer with metallopeptidase domain
MNRIILMLAGAFSASSLLLVDVAVKSTALLLLAILAARLLRRDSAATRHLVWLLAMVAVLAAPALSALLPGWRVLPEWANLSPQAAAADASAHAVAQPSNGRAELPDTSEPVEIMDPPATAPAPAAPLPAARPASASPAAALTPAAPGWTWSDIFPLVWVSGVSVLLLRLLAARLLLSKTERHGTILWPAKHLNVTDDPLVSALEAARGQLGIRRPVTLVLHPDRAIPVVWGIRRSRLLLPAAARAWSGEQLRSVLLHELAHVKRGDTLGQLLAQVACALSWFNPLVWFAAWRLGVERERACDDLVLASGVRPSAYAGHLLDIVTGLAPVRRLQSCGLAMARQSSLEGRLLAVLSRKLNRRGVSAALAALAFAIAVGIAVPLAMLRAADQEAPGQRQEGDTVKTPAQQPKPGEELPRDMEENLRWGNSVNGLRAALALRPAPDQAKAASTPNLYLVVQNVSKDPIRLSDADVSPKVNLRLLYLRSDDRILWALGAREPALGDLLLLPRQAAFLPVLSADIKVNGRTVGQEIVDGLLKDTRQTLFAELQIDKAPAGAWTGKLTTGETSGAEAGGGPQPKNKAAQALFQRWQENARGNGDIPGGLLGLLDDKVKEFIRNNKNDIWGKAHAQLLEQLEQLAPRLNGNQDWKAADAAKRLDDIAAVQTTPLETALYKMGTFTFRKVLPLPKAMANAPWGETQASGLRLAWRLEPQAAEYRLGTPLKSAILIHNAGKETVFFRTQDWHQSSQHKARDASGADIQVTSTYWTRLSHLEAFRLAPGEYVALPAAGIGIGKDKNQEDWTNTRVGAWIHAKAGDEVTFTPDGLDLSDSKEPPQRDGQPGWWPEFIAARLALEVPLPAMADERTRLLGHVTRDLFGTAPTAEETAAFVADQTPGALEALVKRLAHRAGVTAFSGSLLSGETKFRVLPPDPDAAKKPRVVSNPGWYTLGDLVRLSVTRRPDGERIVNEASIVFFSADQKSPAPAKPYPIKLPDGYNNWAAAWLRGATVLWVKEKDVVRSHDFTNPAQVKEMTYEGAAGLQQVSQPIRDALRAALEQPDTTNSATELPRKGRKGKARN